MRSIKSKLALSLLLFAFITVFSLESIIYFVLSEYYFNSISTMLSKQGEAAAAFYESYLGAEELTASAGELANFSKSASTATQIIDSRYQLVGGNLGTIGERVDGVHDLRMALGGAIGTWKGNIATGEEIMSVAYPLRQGNHVVGAIRVMTSTENANSVLLNTALLLIAIGLALIAIVFMISLSIAKAITSPLSNMVHFAEQMASGDLTVRIAEENLKETSILAGALNQMAEELSKLEEMKKAFIASVSHELRTPLTSIKGWAVTLHRSKSIDEESRSLGLKIIESECDRLTAMVEQLLDFSSYLTGQSKLNLTAVNPKDLLEGIMEQFRPRAAAARLKVDLQIKNPLPAMKVDEQKIRQVIINLIDNAMKFTPAEGSIKLGLDRADGYGVIIIEDNGYGIEKKELPRITERFYKGKSKSSGSGLGLAISKEIIKMHQGKIKIDSEPGKGTKVSVFLPL